jgi:predicted transcriptional regulator
MDITIHLEEEQSDKLKYIQQQTKQDPAAILNRSLAEVIDTYYQQIRSSRLDSLVQLRQSKFIGCFKGEADLAANSEENFKEIMNEKYDPC